jgi:hypothetical protein
MVSILNNLGMKINWMLPNWAWTLSPRVVDFFGEAMVWESDDGDLGRNEVLKVVRGEDRRDSFAMEAIFCELNCLFLVCYSMRHPLLSITHVLSVYGILPLSHLLITSPPRGRQHSMIYMNS